MTGESTLARFRGVRVSSWLQIEAVAPAVGVALCDGWHGMRSDRVGDGGRGNNGRNDIGIASRLTAKNTGAFVVSNLKVEFECCKSLLGGWEFAPVADVMDKGARVLQVVDGGSEDSGVTDWFSRAGGKVLAFFNLVPEVGEGLFGAPLAAEIF
jgi:hypothetical protein